MKKLFAVGLCLVFTLILSGQTLYNLIQDSPNHTTLETLVDAAGISGILNSGGSKTFFAPDDSAFDLLGQSVIDELLLDPSGELKSILLFHLYLDDVSIGLLQDGGPLQMAEGKEALLLNYESAIYINQAKTESETTVASNGSLYSINEIISPINSVLDLIANSPNTQQFYNWILDANLESEFANAEESTFIIYADGAFPFNYPHQLYTLTNPEGMFNRFLLNYIKSGVNYSPSLVSGFELIGASGYINEVSNPGGNHPHLGPNGVIIGIKDVTVPNGVAHFINHGILIPSDDDPLQVMDKNEELSIYREIVSLAKYEDTLTAYYDNGLTVFAPTNNAFESLTADSLQNLFSDTIGMRALIQLHTVNTDVLSSGKIGEGIVVEATSGDSLSLIQDNYEISVNGIRIADVDFICGNAMVHVIDQFIPTDTLPNILEIIVNHPQLQQLEFLAAVSTLAPALSEEGPFTLFAPTDSAFVNFGTQEFQDLLLDLDNGLADFLNYHLFEGEIFTDDIDLGFNETRLGENIEVTALDNIELNDMAFVTVENIMASNGVVHIIDALLVPPSVGVGDVLPKEFGFKISPNPTSDFINIKLDAEAKGITSLECFDQLGRLIQRLDHPASQSTLDLSSFAKGHYFLKLNTEAGSAVKVFQVQ